MSRPPHAREKVLDSFEALLVDGPGGGATMDAVAAHAGVSKGGLLYHFPSKAALEEALVARMRALAADDVAAMEADPAGIVDAFIRTSTFEDTPLNRAMLAATRLANSGSAHAQDALNALRDAWRAAIRPHVADDTALTLVMLVADGVYFNAMLAATRDDTRLFGMLPEMTDMDALITLVRRAVSPASAPDAARSTH